MHSNWKINCNGPHQIFIKGPFSVNGLRSTGWMIVQVQWLMTSEYQLIGHQNLYRGNLGYGSWKKTKIN